MPNTDTPSPRLDFDILLRKKLGALFDWEKPIIEDTVGPYQPKIFDSFEKKRSALIAECRRCLASFSDADAALLYHRNFADPDGKRTAWKAFLSKEIRDLQRRRPPWLAGGFGHPDFIADFSYWGMMEKFSLHEALLLSVGVEPKHISENTMDKALKNKEPEKLLPAFQYLLKRRELFRRKFPSGWDGFNSVLPSFLKSWFDEVEMDIHPGFYAELEKRVPERRGETPTEGSKPINGVERQTLLKMVAAMACEQYNYNPNDARSPATSRIRDDIETVGLSMDSKTVLKCLKEAMELVADEYWDESVRT